MIIMPKKSKEYSNKQKQETSDSKSQSPLQNQEAKILSKLPPEVQDKLKAIKEKLDTFQKRVIEKFDKYIVGISLMPPPQQQKASQPPQQIQPQPQLQQGAIPHSIQNRNIEPQPDSQNEKDSKLPNLDKDKIHVLVVVDDSDSQKMTKTELKDKLAAIMIGVAKEIDEKIVVQTIILSEIWQNCFDAKYDILQIIAMSAPIYDKGMLQAIKIAEIHKTMVLKKFEKYIVSYVLAGSLVQGRATPTSDIDVWIVIDDTDVKKMTRVELKDKLRAIIIGMGIEAGELTGVKNKINIQVYILTDFWDSLREANPVIFTLLRDGVPFFDRGIFMPWKQLLKMGKIKPSPEAIDIFMGSGEQVLRRVQTRINEIGMEDIYYAILTPSQAALMLYGIAPPAPKETAQLMKEVFVQKENLLEEKFVKILENNIQIRKAIEHNEKKEISGKELDELLTNADKYLKRIKRLFSQIEKIREEKDIINIYDTATSMVRDALRLDGIEKTSESELQKLFDTKLVHEGKLQSKLSKILENIIKAKKDYNSGKLTKLEIDNVHKDYQFFIRSMLEYIQRRRGRELERAKIRVKYGQKYGEVILLETHAYVVHDIDAKEKEISKGALKEDGGISELEKSTLEEMEKSIANAKIPKRAFIKEPVFEDLKRIFGRDVEVLVNY